MILYGFLQSASQRGMRGTQRGMRGMRAMRGTIHSEACEP